MRRRWLRATMVLLSLVSLLACGSPDAPRSARASAEASVVDACDDLTPWSAHPADGVSLDLALDEGLHGQAVRLDFDIPGGGYAVARVDVDLELPDNYVFRFFLRGEARVNHLEFKLLDETGDSVWWSVRRDFAFPSEWTRVAIKKRHLAFAWGPKGGGDIHRVSAIEFAVTAGEGGTGQVWIDQIELVPRAPVDATLPNPVASASSAASGSAIGHIVDADPRTEWQPDPADGQPWIMLDLGGVHEYSGLRVEWSPGRQAADYVLESSEDGSDWVTLRTVIGSNGGHDTHHLPESESRFVRLRVLRSSGPSTVALAEIELMPVQWAESRLAFFQELAMGAPRGSYPRGMQGEQAYWTIVGVDADPREALLGEDGALELGKGLASVEPFLFADGELITWADAQIEQSLDHGFLPIPTVQWTLPDVELRVTAFGTGPPGTSQVVLRYTVANRGRQSRSARLYLAVRPFQVNPPTQTLNLAGGLATVRSIEGRGGKITIDGQSRVRALTPWSDFGAATFDHGDIVVDYLAHGRLPAPTQVEDSFGAASAALEYGLSLAPGESQDVDLMVRLYPEAHGSGSSAADAGVWVDEQLESARQRWLERTERVTIDLPPVAQEIEHTLKSQLCYILLNRAGPSIQPGPRSYARSWIRDGALTSWALLRLGHVEPAREFLEWYAPFQYDHGKIPCVVDSRGADPVDEHDSSGEFIFLVAELYRTTGNESWLAALWPRVRDAAHYLDGLRQQRRTPEYQVPDQAPYYGILPPSISHEGYSAKPMHSYWDDFFAVLGFREAVFIAEELGHAEDATRLEAIREEFERDFSASVVAAQRTHAIDFVPGCADLGDFDPTSTTIALTPVGAGGLLPEGALARTFERYWEFFRDRRDGAPWDAYTPYEIRSVGAFVRLGWRERAAELLDFFLSHRRPVGWRQWPEVVRRDVREPGFLGDLPHTWVGSDFVRSVLDMLAYDDGDVLVVGAGIPVAWLEPPGVRVHGLPTRYGALEFSLVRSGPSLVAELGGNLTLPRRGILLCPPPEGLAGAATVNGVRADVDREGRILVQDLPAEIILR